MRPDHWRRALASSSLACAPVVVCPIAPGATSSMPHISNRSSDAGTGMNMRHACQVGASRVKRDAR